MTGIIENMREPISEICARHGVARLYVFGSALGDSYEPGENDLDLLVEFAPIEQYARVEIYLAAGRASTLLHTKIDLIMAGAVMNPYIARDIERTKQVLYAA
ncbi:nucleotidyltransferase domain-containing protein [Candidatus Sumerlaeota bacterium]|nr:nucleotidyltransferase domain-containing protein [Candidatus Sumerlaeota bacterium]